MLTEALTGAGIEAEARQGTIDRASEMLDALFAEAQAFDGDRRAPTAIARYLCLRGWPAILAGLVPLLLARHGVVAKDAQQMAVARLMRSFEQSEDATRF